MAIKSNLFAAVGGYHGRAGQQGKVGIFARLADRGEWEQKVADVEGCCVAVHPRDPRTIFAGTKDGIYRSKDGGATFEKMNFPFEGISVWSFLFDARDDQVIYAGGSPIMVYRSVDGGMSWVSLPNSTVPDPAENIPFKCRVMCMVQHPLKPDTIFAAMEVNGVTRTDDGGASWTNCSADLIAKADLDQYKSSILTEVDAEGMLDVHAIAISGSEPDKVFIANRMGLWESQDAGATWSDLHIERFSPVTYGRDLCVSKGDANVMFAAMSVSAASHEGGIYRSEDVGRSWIRFDKVEVNGTVMSIAQPASNPECIFLAARYDGEIYGTEDGGATWHAFAMPSDVKDIYRLAAS